LSGFTKLFSSIVTSSLWGESESTRVVFVTMLALADRFGVVEGSVGGLARAANVSREATERALETLAAPDPDDRSGVAEGRRIEAVQGGWRILNYLAYREKGRNEDRRDYFREKKRAQRSAAKLSTLSTDVHTIPPIAEADADAEEKQRGAIAPLPPALDTPEFRSAWSDWFAYRRERRLGTWKQQTVTKKLAECERCGAVASIAAINDSIGNGYAGFWPDKFATKSKASGSALPVAYGEENSAAWDKKIRRVKA
jgi:hypothetical protein